MNNTHHLTKVMDKTTQKPNEKREFLKKLILELHETENMDKVKKQFKSKFSDVDSTEIASMEQELIENGELTAEQVTKLCNVHVEVFKDELNNQKSAELIPGHPIHTYREENKIALDLVRDLRKAVKPLKMIKLSKITSHYTRLENQLFPILEKVGFSGPSQVMWAKHDEVRRMINDKKKEEFPALLDEIEGLVFKEEKILFPTALEKLTEEQWIAVKRGEEEIGFAWIKPGTQWNPVTPEQIHIGKNESKTPISRMISKIIDLSTGKLDLEVLDLILTMLPVDISVVNEKDEVIYYSNNPDRVFPRSPGVIGRNVKNCHPPKSQHIVKRILDAFKNGSQNTAEFWLELGGQFIYIQYFAIRDSMGKFRGTLEVTQDVTKIRGLKGTQRLLNWNEQH
ncbi:hypothetical protein WKT22_01121 [Candidatus Lokiarchaeum ossiferum]